MPRWAFFTSSFFVSTTMSYLPWIFFSGGSGTTVVEHAVRSLGAPFTSTRHMRHWPTTERAGCQQ